MSWVDSAGQRVLRPKSLERRAILKELPLVCWCQNILLRVSSARAGCGPWLADFTDLRLSQSAMLTKVFREHIHLHVHEEKRKDTSWMVLTSTSLHFPWPLYRYGNPLDKSSVPLVLATCHQHTETRFIQTHTITPTYPGHPQDHSVIFHLKENHSLPKVLHRSLVQSG